jgi:acyl carrier protein
MNKNEFFHKIEEIIEAAPGSVAEQTNLGDLDGWDSLAIMGFITMMDEDLGIIPEAKAVKACRTAADLLALAGSAVEV